MTAEQYAHDLVKVLLAHRNDALPVARAVLAELSTLAGRGQCVICGCDFKRHVSAPQQRYCGKRCREHHKYVTYKKGKPR